MSKKLSIKPVHLVVLGLTILVLGILIPSFFIDPSSTIGLSLIMGSIILLSAYAFFAVNVVRSKGKKSIKWLVLPVLLVLLVSGGFYANHKHQQSVANKIYLVGETVAMDGFTFKITNTTSEDIPMNLQGINLADRKDCSGLVGDRHAYRDCDWYNWPRRNAQNYLDEYNRRVTVYYEVRANNDVDADFFNIKLVPASGREIKTVSSNDSNGDQTFSFLWQLGQEINGNHDSLEYIANPRSDFGGDVMRGITREGWIGVDLKKSEKIYDIIVQYKDQTRTIRIGE